MQCARAATQLHAELPGSMVSLLISQPAGAEKYAFSCQCVQRRTGLLRHDRPSDRVQGVSSVPCCFETMRGRAPRCATRRRSETRLLTTQVGLCMRVQLSACSRFHGYMQCAQINSGATSSAKAGGRTRSRCSGKHPAKPPVNARGRSGAHGCVAAHRVGGCR